MLALIEGRRRLSSHVIFAALMAGLLFGIFATFKSYGLTWDEDLQSQYGRLVLRWYASGFRDLSAAHFGNLYLYGGFFESLAEWTARRLPFGLFESRHLVGALFSSLAFVAVFRIGARVSGAGVGVLASLLLALYPPYYGHLFANSKDLPFAATYAVGLWFILRSLDALRRGSRPAILPLGLAIGVSAGVRVWGLALLGWLALLWLLEGWFARHNRVSWSQRAASFGGVALVAWLTMLACWPWASTDPIMGPIRALGATARLRPDITLLYGGEQISGDALPWHYVPVWFGLTLPEGHLLALGATVVLALRASPALWVRLRAEGPAPGDIVVLWLSIVAALPLLLAIIARPFLYNGIRHLLFVCPPLFVLMAVGFAGVLRQLPWRPLRWLLSLGLASSFGLTVRDMMDLHPYETVYFNRLVASGLRGAADRYETDYWGSTMKEGAEWIMANYSPLPGRRLVVGVVGDARQVSYYFQKRPEGAAFEASEGGREPDLLLIARTHPRYRRVKGVLLHTVERQSTALLYIFEIHPGQGTVKAGPQGN